MSKEDPAKNLTASTGNPIEIPQGDAEELMEIPSGFHRMSNGDIMANNRMKAKAPEGYRLTEGGILKKTGDSDNLPDLTPITAAAVTVEEFGSIPPGYHRMPDGTLMANSPSKAKAPEGYHLMPDGTLMKNGTVSMDHSAHSHATTGNKRCY